MSPKAHEPLGQVLQGSGTGLSGVSEVGSMAEGEWENTVGEDEEIDEDQLALVFCY